MESSGCPPKEMAAEEENFQRFSLFVLHDDTHIYCYVEEECNYGWLVDNVKMISNGRVDRIDGDLFINKDAVRVYFSIEGK